MNSVLCRAGTIALFLAAAAFAPAQETVVLKPQWRVGKKYSQSTTTTQETSIDIGDKTITQRSGTTMEMSTSVLPAEAGNGKRLSISYERVSMEMDMNGQKFGYDSGKPDAADPLGLGKSLGGLVGKTIVVVMNEKDEVIGVEDFEKMMNEAFAGNPAAEQLKGMFSKETVANMIGQSVLYATPAGPVKAGDQWPFTLRFELPRIGKVATNGAYTLKSVSEKEGIKTAELGIEGKLTIDMSELANGGAAPGVGSAMRELGVEMKGGTMNGTVWFDPALGMTRESTLNQDMTITMKNPTAPEETMTLPIRQVITQRLLKVEDL